MQTSGRVEYGARAFEQDADQAIRGDVVRALIELITNSDDAYGDNPGPIFVRVQSTEDADFPVRVLVQDSAKGLAAEGLRKSFAVLGGERSVDDGGASARGLLGRGAKDVASLGRVEFHAIKGGHYSRLDLSSAGDWKLHAVDLPASDQDRTFLGLEPDENGLTNVLWIRARTRVPTRTKLEELLSRHAQLRRLVARRSVFLEDTRADSPFLVRLSAPERRGEVVLDRELAIAGYEVPARLTVRRLPTKSSASVGPYSDTGLLINSGVSTFENSWLGLDHMPEANFFAGELDAPQIAQIIRAFDRDDPLGGSFRLLARDRDGLVPTHPYRQALALAVGAAVKPLFDDVAKSMDARKRQGADLSRAFRVAGDALKEQFNRALEEIEDDEPLSGGTSPSDDLVLIPPRRVAKPGESVTFSLRSTRPQPGEPSATVDKASSEDVVNSLAVSREGWAPHPRLDARITHVFATAGDVDGSAEIRVSVDGRVVFATLVVSSLDAPDEDPPDSFEIEPSRAHISPGRGRRLRIRADIAHVDALVQITYEGIQLETVPKQLALGAEINGRWAEGWLRIKASHLRGEGRLRATSSLDGSIAECQLNIDESAGRGGLGIDITLSGHRSPTRRVELINDQGQIRITIYALHRSFGGVFGRYSDLDEKFSEEDSPAARAVLAEVISSELAGHLTERDYAKRPDQLNDAPRVLRRRADFQARFLPVAHRALQPSAS